MGAETGPCMISAEEQCLYCTGGDENFPLASCEGKECADCEAAVLLVSDSNRSVPGVDDGTVDLAQGGRRTDGEAGSMAVVRGGIHWWRTSTAKNELRCIKASVEP